MFTTHKKARLLKDGVCLNDEQGGYEATGKVNVVWDII